MKITLSIIALLLFIACSGEDDANDDPSVGLPAFASVTFELKNPEENLYEDDEVLFSNKLELTDKGLVPINGPDFVWTPMGIAENYIENFDNTIVYGTKCVQCAEEYTFHEVATITGNDGKNLVSREYYILIDYPNKANDTLQFVTQRNFTENTATTLEIYVNGVAKDFFGLNNVIVNDDPFTTFYISLD